MTKDHRSRKLGVLAPVALSACMDASVLAVPAAGAIVSTVLKELSKAFMLKKWFHGSMTAKEAENLMMQKGKNGSFLIRESKGHPGDYVLTVRGRGRVSHVIIRKQHNKYDVGSGEQFDDLVGLIEHFRLYPMIESSGDVLRLIQPVNGTTLKVTEIQKRLHEMNEIIDIAEEKKSRIDSEYQTILAMGNPYEFTTIEASKPENMSRNRYANILPYDQTRVILHENIDGISCTDYINANYISSYNLSDSLSSIKSSNDSTEFINSNKLECIKTDQPVLSKSLSDEALRDLKLSLKIDKINGNNNSTAFTPNARRYIATQGCLSNTKADFWRMIWQEDIRIIVMITKEIENGKKKCERYWPERQEEHFKGFDVQLITTTQHSDYLVRELEVRYEKKNCRTVYQYNFTTWPDHGTPQKASSVLAFIIDINKRMNSIMSASNKPEQDILCVHCSAGVGRTGTFVVLDVLLNNINSNGFNCEIDVSNTVKIIRSQRNGMVQNKLQYRFIYLALQEYAENYKIKC